MDSFASKESKTISTKKEQQATNSKPMQVSNSEKTMRLKNKVHIVTCVDGKFVDLFACKESESFNAKSDQQAANSKPMLQGCSVL